jgi:hypothetical protein
MRIYTHAHLLERGQVVGHGVHHLNLEVAELGDAQLSTGRATTT